VKVKWVPATQLLRLQRRSVEIEPDTTYQEIGVRSFGRGLFLKDPVSGVEIGSKRVFEIHEGDFVVSNVFAWEGAVGIAGAEHHGRIGSHRFMTWIPVSDVKVDYLAEFFRSSRGVEALAAASPGSAGRNRTLSIANFEAIRVPLPSDADQERIAAYLSLLARTPPVLPKGGGQQAQELAEGQWLRRYTTVRLLDIATIGPAPRRVEPETVVSFVPMGAVDATTGAIVGAVPRARSEVGAGYRQFVDGDIIFARITPSMQNGKAAIYRPAEGRVGYGSTEFHVLRPNDSRFTEWIWAVLRTRWFRDLAARSFTGTAGQQRVPAEFMRNVPIPLPRLDELSGATEALLRSQRTAQAIENVERRRALLGAAILPAARNEIFNAMR